VKSYKENLFKGITYTSALFVLFFLLSIISSIFREGITIFGTIGIKDFLLGTAYYPTQEPPKFGVFSLILGSVYVTAGALLIAIPLGLGAAVYIAEIASLKIKEITKPIIELLAGIPSVVYGLFGITFLAPAIRQWFGLDSGLNIFSASIILGIMIIPIITSMSEDALNTIPKELREASLALGANKWETITKIIIPAAKSGIIGSILLGFGRAIGETMVVLMVAGGSAQIPHSIFSSVRPMTSAIAAEMGETVVGDLHYYALFALAMVLFVITLISNLITELVFLKQVKK